MNIWLYQFPVYMTKRKTINALNRQSHCLNAMSSSLCDSVCFVHWGLEEKPHFSIFPFSFNWRDTEVLKLADNTELLSILRTENNDCHHQIFRCCDLVNFIYRNQWVILPLALSSLQVFCNALFVPYNMALHNPFHKLSMVSSVYVG